MNQTIYPLEAFLRLDNTGACPGSKMTISGCPEVGLEDVPWTLTAHHIDILRTSVDPKMVQILTKIFKTLLKKLIFMKVLDNHLYTRKA